MNQGRWTKSAAMILGGLLTVVAMTPEARAAAMASITAIPDATQLGLQSPDGWIVGTRPLGDSKSGISQAFVEVNGRAYDYGTFGTFGTFAGPASTATAVNNFGVIVGTYTLGVETAQRAFAAAGGTFVAGGSYFSDLGTLGGSNSIPTGINMYNQVVGESTTASGATHAFSDRLNAGGEVTDLGTLGGLNSSAAGLNNAGQIVGQSGLASGATHAFLYSGGTMNDLGTLGGSNSFGYGINGAGAVVGQSYTTGDTAAHAFLILPGGTMTDLGTLPGFTSSIARSINESGQIVGNAYGKVDPITGTFLQHAFLYDHGTLEDLNSALPAGSGWVLTEATSIEDHGIIIGFGLHNGQREAYQLSVENVPEPTTLALLALIMAGAGARAVAHRVRG